MYRRGPSADDLKTMEFLGLSQADLEGSEEVEIWPENLEAFRLFQTVSSSWFVGPGGPTGLRYEVLPTIFDLYNVRKKDRREVFEALQVMESEALKQMNQPAK